MAGNRIVVDLEVDPNGKGQATINKLKTDLEAFRRQDGTAAVTRGLTDAGGAASKFTGQLGGLKSELSGLALEFAPPIAAATALKTVLEESYTAGIAYGRANKVLSASSKEAGISFDETAAAAARFAAATGTSVTQANEFYATALQFAKAAGQTNRLDEFAQGFANLAAARGRSTAEYAEIVGQLQAGVDDATDKLFGKNPSVIQEEYARSLGRTLNSLSDVEKRYALFNAVTEKGNFFNGEASRNLETLGGKADYVKSAFVDMFASIGNGANIVINKLGLFKDSLDFVLFEQNRDRIRSGFFSGSDDQDRAEGIANLQKLRENEFRSRIKAEAEAKIEAQRLTQDKIREQFGSGLKEFQDRTAALAKAEAQAAKEAEQKRKEQAEKAKTAASDALSFVTNLAVQTNADNPFVKLFNDFETAADRAEKRFGIFGKSFVAQMAEIERAQLRGQIGQARFNAELGALRSRQAADALDRPLAGLSGSQERQLETLRAQINLLSVERDGRRNANPFAAVRDLQNLSIAANSPTARALIADEILKLIGNSDDRRFSSARSFAQGARREAAQFDLTNALERERAGSSIQQQAREQLQLLRRATGLSQDQRLKEFLAITGALDPKELTGDLRSGRADALRIDATRQEQREREAREINRSILTEIQQIKDALTRKGIKLDEATAAVEIRIDENGNATKRELGSTGKNESRRSFNPNRNDDPFDF